MGWLDNPDFLIDYNWKLVNVFDAMGAKAKRNLLDEYSDLSKVSEFLISDGPFEKTIEISLDNGLSFTIGNSTRINQGMSSADSIFNKSLIVSTDRYQFLLTKP